VRLSHFSKAILWLGLIAPSSGQAAEVVDRIVAVVGNDIILDSDVKAFVRSRSSERFGPRLDQARLNPADNPKINSGLEELIREKLLQQEIAHLEITVTDQELSGAIGNVLGRNHMTQEALHKELAAKGVSFDNYRKQMTEEVKRMKFVGQIIYPRIHVTEAELNRRLPAHASDTDKQRIRQEIIESQLAAELNKYLDEVRTKSYVEIKN